MRSIEETKKAALNLPGGVSANEQIVAQYQAGARLITLAGAMPVERLIPGLVVIDCDGLQREVISVRLGRVQQPLVHTRPSKSIKDKRTRFAGTHPARTSAPDTVFEVRLDVVKPNGGAKVTGVPLSIGPSTSQSIAVA